MCSLQSARGAANGDRLEPGALNQNIFGGERDFGFGAAHDAADADDARAIAIADHADAGIDVALDAVERFDFFFCCAARTTMRWSRILS